MTSYAVNTGYVQQGYPADVQNAGYDRNRDTEMLDLTGVVGNDPPRRKHFDWFILSVLSYICCAPIGLCAMYYSIRANHGHDYNIETYKIHNSNTKAKVLTVLSIILGSLFLLGMIIAMIVIIQNIKSTYQPVMNQMNDYTG